MTSGIPSSAGDGLTAVEEPSRGNRPAPRSSLIRCCTISSLAQSDAFQLSNDLMVPVTVFQAGGEQGVLPSDEIDADDDLQVVTEFFPWLAQ